MSVFPLLAASILHSAVLTAHPGGKKPTPQVEQVPYMRVSLTASPPLVCIQRVCFPRAHSGLPQVAHLGRSSSGTSLHSSLSPTCTTSWISCARTWLICSSIAASISAHVADLLLFSPLGDSQHISQSCTHLFYLLTPLPCVLLRFHPLASLAYCFPAVYITSLLRAK